MGCDKIICEFIGLKFKLRHLLANLVKHIVAQNCEQESVDQGKPKDVLVDKRISQCQFQKVALGLSRHAKVAFVVAFYIVNRH